MAQLVKIPPAIRETPVQFLGQEDLLEERLPTPVFLGFPSGSDSKESTCTAGDLCFDSWVRKIPWRRAWQPTLVFLPGEFPRTVEPGGLQSMGSQRVGHA